MIRVGCIASRYHWCRYRHIGGVVRSNAQTATACSPTSTSLSSLSSSSSSSLCSSISVTMRSSTPSSSNGSSSDVVGRTTSKRRSHHSNCNRSSSNSSNNRKHGAGCGKSSSAVAATAHVLFAFAAVVSLRPMSTLADKGGGGEMPAVPNIETTTEGGEQCGDDKKKAGRMIMNGKIEECPFYGCPVYPLDIVVKQPDSSEHNQRHAQGALKALSQIRNLSQDELYAGEKKSKLSLSNCRELLETTGREDVATLTMTGFKGGHPRSQINQDRSFVVSPFFVGTGEEEGSSASSSGGDRILMGVFDGHSVHGELVSEYAVTELPKLLSKKLHEAFGTSSLESETESKSIEQVEITKKILHDTFVEIDRTAPAETSGGCTASVVLKQGRKVYVANAGDSRSFIVSYRKSTRETKIVYISREDKPNLPSERKRVEEMGGSIYAPEVGTSRVLHLDPITRTQTGLAMSRSIGDWAFGALGVVPDPIVDVIDIPDLVQTELNAANPDNSIEVDDDICFFAVSATDGMLDYILATGISKFLAYSLFDDNTTSNLISSCEALVEYGCQGWYRYKGDAYRDDIAISVATLRIPPPPKRSSLSDSKPDSSVSSTAEL